LLGFIPALVYPGVSQSVDFITGHMTSWLT